MFRYIVTCLVFCCVLNGCIGKSYECLQIDGLDEFLNPGQIILLGDIHGTKEAPLFVEHITCNALNKNLNVTVDGYFLVAGTTKIGPNDYDIGF